MTPPTMDLLDLAEAVAEGTMSPAEAETRLRSDPESDAASVAELRALVAAMTAVMAHANAFQEGLATAPTAKDALSQGATQIAVAAGAVRRRPGSPRSGSPRRTMLLVAAVLLLGVAAGSVMVAGGLTTSLSPTSLASPAVVPTTGPTTLPSTAPSPAEASTDWKALGDPFVVSTRRDATATDFAHRYADWVSRPDGSQATKLDHTWQLAWSRDGRRLMAATADGELIRGRRRFRGAAGRLGAQHASRQGLPEEGRWTDHVPAPVVRPVARRPAPRLRAAAEPPPRLLWRRHDGPDDRMFTVLEATLSRDSKPIEGVRWSPDGSKLVYSRIDDLGVLGRNGLPQSDLLIVDADGQNLHRLDLQGLSASAPDWSLNGQTIAFASDIWRTDTKHESDIYTIAADGSSMRRLSSDGDRYQPTWLSDGRILYWSGDRFWVMTADGNDASPLPVLAGLDRPISGTGLPWSGLRIQPRP